MRTNKKYEMMSRASTSLRTDSRCCITLNADMTQTLKQLLEDLMLNPADLRPTLAHLGAVLVEVAHP